MKPSVIYLKVAAALWLVCNCAFAGGVESDAITKAMKSMFDKPDAPLSVDAVTVSSDYGLASWTQQSKGGRALLKKAGATWEIVVCGGKDLLQTSVLQKVGLSQEKAENLIAELKKTEKQLAASKRKQFDSFQLGEQGHHGPH
jgi:hypothetical protein